MADIEKIKIGNTEYNVKDVTSGYITGIDSTDVTDALGYTPYNSTNPNGYTSNIGTVTSVNGNTPNASGEVTVSVPSALGDLSNVSISSPTAGQNLTYDATNQVWKNTSTSATIAWGGITGTLSDQTDLANALGDKYDASNPDGYITGITSSDVTTALGYTPYSSSNPNGYTSNVGTVTSVNNTSPVNGNVTLSIPTVPTNISAFTNDSGYITGITSSDVTTALGYTPYNSSNPNGYTSNVGTVTSVNNTSPVNGNVSLTIPTVNVDDVQINGTSILSSKVANIVTNTAYNSSSNKIATMSDLPIVPTNISSFTNDSGYVTSDTQNTCGADNTTSKIYLVGRTAQSTGISNSNQSVYTENGYLYAKTPSASSNGTSVATTKWVTDKGYTTNTGTVTSVNNTSPDANGNVSLTIPTVNDATLTITQGGTTKGTFTANASSNVTIDLDAGGGGSSLPDQTGHSGDILTTDGTDASWADTAQIYPIIESYANGSDWYNVYSNGYCEQGGKLDSGLGTSGTVAFLKSYSFNGKGFGIQQCSQYTNYGGYFCLTSSAVTGFAWSKVNTNVVTYWKAQGYVDLSS